MKKSQLLAFALLSFLFSSAFGQDSSMSFSLSEAQAYALEHSYQTRTSAMTVEQSKKKVSETIATGLPQVSATGSYQQYIKTPIQLIPASAFGGPEGEFAEVFFGTEQQMSAAITAEQLIFDGSYFVGLQAAKVYLELSKNDLEKSEIDIKNIVAMAYGNVLVAEENAKILEENVKNLEKMVFETGELYANGFAEEQDRDQLKLILDRTKTNHDRAVRQIDFNRNQLKFLLGLSIDSEIELTSDLAELTSARNSAAFAEKDFAVETHIEYKSILTQEKATELLMKQQKSMYYPKISGFFSYQQNSYANEFNFFSDERRWFDAQVIGLNLRVPIFSSFNRRFQVQQARIDYEKVQLARQQVSEQLKLQAKNAKSEYLFALGQYQTSNENLVLAEKIYDKVKTKYSEGINSSLELSQANNQLLEAQGSFINASFQLINAKVNLDKALNTY